LKIKSVAPSFKFVSAVQVLLPFGGKKKKINCGQSMLPKILPLLDAPHADKKAYRFVMGFFVIIP
jgi:hypothetical protein